MLQFIKKLLLISAVRLFAPTIKLINDPWQIINKYHSEGKNILFCLWHESTAYCFYFYRYKKAGLLVEASLKGDVLAAMTRHLGYEDFRITDEAKDRQSVKGTIQFIKYLREGHDGVIALDGPNGPYHEPKPGVFPIAEKTSTYIVPVGIWYKHKIILKNRWDKYQVPLPFTKCVMLMGEPMPAVDDPTEEAINSGLLKITQAIEKLNQAAAELGSKN